MRVPRDRPVGTKGGWGYFVWVGAGLMLAVPEITGMISNGALGFVTASETIGHLERYHNWIELGVIGTLVLLVFSLYKVSVDRAGEADPPASEPTRTPGGRLTFHPRASGIDKAPADFASEHADLIFALCAVA